MIGSEGTLGIVVEATLKLTDPPPPSQVMLLALPGMDALMQVFALFRARLTLQAFEFFTDRALEHVLAHGAQRAIDGHYPYYVVTEFDAADERAQDAALAAFEHALERGWVSDGVIAQALLAREYPQIEVIWFGHIGDGNLHINVLRPDGLVEEAFIAQCEHVTKLLAATLQQHGGSISAEHGIGLVKRAYLESTRSAVEIALMQGVRKVFDPNGILNPGKLFADD
jgi:FAD/FMN-containing dehydrogenase